MTPNQTILLRAVYDAPRTTAQLAAMRKDNGDEFGEDAARSAMKRLEARGLVDGEGHGIHREWTALPPAREALGIPTHDSNSGLRGYVVLEEIKRSELTESDDVVYVKVAEVTGRNTEHAYRQAAKQAYANADHTPTLIAVADKQWRPTPVRVQTRQTVSVGP